MVMAIIRVCFVLFVEAQDRGIHSHHHHECRFCALRTSSRPRAMGAATFPFYKLALGGSLAR